MSHAGAVLGIGIGTELDAQFIDPLQVSPNPQPTNQPSALLCEMCNAKCEKGRKPACVFPGKDR